jgi:sulfhydrogenase subunit alpha
VKDGERTIQVDYLARVEGEGALTIRYRGDEVRDVELRIFEPPRFFEAFLRGRSALEVPDITSRICGICPVAYQMSSCVALESALGVVVPEPLRSFRRLLYCGEWIESHVLHMVMLHAPDFLGVPDAMTMARAHGDLVRAGLRVKKAGNGIVRTLGGREIHPINVKLGGFYKLPRREELRALGDELEACRPLAEALLRWMATFTFPELERDVPMVALAPEGGPYPLMEGPVGCTAPLPGDGAQRIPVEAWPTRFEERHLAHSTALHGRMVDGRAYLVGPQARWALNFDNLPAHLRDLAAELGLERVVRNPFRSLLVRGIEVLWALEEGARLCRELPVDGDPSVPVVLRAGVGHGVSEAPRGILYHRYALDEEGRVLEAHIVPPTSQNQPSIEADLRAIAPELLRMEPAAATARAEHAIRNYDPCISCSVHFLTLRTEEV